MSGIEVVGIVLGSIPLLISGLEHYADGIRTMKNMWEYEAVIGHLVTIFTLDQAIFRHSCQELLLPVLSDTQAAELLDGVSPKWEDKDLDRRLKKRLGDDYQAYTHSTRMLTRRIKLFVRKSGLDEKTMLVSSDLRNRGPLSQHCFSPPGSRTQNLRIRPCASISFVTNGKRSKSASTLQL